ncbi:two-component system regulatory protein YycI [Desmospora profundinema]|uniref:Regulatory protein YycI of two-component signal transduction system YycFG n=1 Tax=Desmospora profundinema TaxID=1571184 RepID=A0ABU1IKU1_9BACL|nr:two-component system regulatory protein YycI [Desmospora profundinema]MDR6225402.1 regulatory protein YycI of two-component signal transduction system YycFG [Desmospora profundinema]
MDWSKAKTILILAFLALNLFLAGQLLEARVEQSEDLDTTESTKRELDQLAQEKEIDIRVELPTDVPPVTYLEATPTNPGSEWKTEADGSYSKKWETPLIPVQELKKQAVNFTDYRYHADDSNPVQRVYYQYRANRPLFDASLTVQVEEGKIASIQQTHFEIKQNNTPAQTGVTAHTALLSLIESGKLNKGETVTAVELGYHGSSYEATVRILSPVWRIQTDKKDTYVNAITGVSEVVTTDSKGIPEKKRE